MQKGLTFRVPNRRRPLGDYRRPCDRCGWDGWLRSEESREPQTNLLVCNPCLNKADPSKETGKFVKRDSMKIKD